MATDNTFLIKFYDSLNQTNPSSFTAKEIGDLLIYFEDAVKSIIDLRFPNSDIGQTQIYLSGVKNESNGIYLGIDNSKETQEATDILGRSINKGAYSDYGGAVYKLVSHVVNLSRVKNCNADFRKRNENLGTITPDFKIIKPESVIIKSPTTLYGTIEKVGREADGKPKVWLKLFNQRIIKFSVSIEDFNDLQKHIFSEVGLTGTASLNTVTLNYTSFKLSDILEYKAGNVYDAIKEIRGITSGYWDNFKTDKEITEHLKGDA
jgi:hypothetical protein